MQLWSKGYSHTEFQFFLHFFIVRLPNLFRCMLTYLRCSNESGNHLLTICNLNGNEKTSVCVNCYETYIINRLSLKLLIAMYAYIFAMQQRNW